MLLNGDYVWFKLSGKERFWPAQLLTFLQEYTFDEAAFSQAGFFYDSATNFDGHIGEHIHQRFREIVQPSLIGWDALEQGFHWYCFGCGTALVFETTLQIKRGEPKPANLPSLFLQSHRMSCSNCCREQLSSESLAALRTLIRANPDPYAALGAKRFLLSFLDLYPVGWYPGGGRKEKDRTEQQRVLNQVMEERRNRFYGQNEPFDPALPRRGHTHWPRKGEF